MSIGKSSYLVPCGNLSIAVEEYGDPQGLPVIALHGWLDNSASFYAIAEYLEGVRLIALDLIGHGHSSFRPLGMPYHIWDNLTDLNALITQLDLGPVAIVGHSMGASIGSLFAGAFPNKVTKLLCIEGLAPLYYEQEQVPESLAAAISKRQRLAARTLRHYANKEEALRARMNGRWPVSRQAAEHLLEKGLQKTAEGYCWSHDPSLLLPSILRFSPEQIHAFLGAIKAQTTIIKATNGASYLIDDWLDKLANPELIELEGGHHLHMEAAAAANIANIMNQWVK